MVDVKVIVIVILALAAVSFLIWALIVQSRYDSRAANIVQNPYCLRVGCGNGSLPLAYLLSPENDPQRVSYQTLNWCIVNAPPTQFVRALENCNGGQGWKDPNSDENKLLAAFINWYPNAYMPTCGNSFKDEPVTTLFDGSAPGIEDQRSPLANPADKQNYINSPCTYLGPNDDAGAYAIQCARLSNLTHLEGYKQLLDIYQEQFSQGCY